jgi:hypothetical protein
VFRVLYLRIKLLEPNAQQLYVEPMLRMYEALSPLYTTFKEGA